MKGSFFSSSLCGDEQYDVRLNWWIKTYILIVERSRNVTPACGSCSCKFFKVNQVGQVDIDGLEDVN